MQIRVNTRGTIRKNTQARILFPRIFRREEAILKTDRYFGRLPQSVKNVGKAKFMNKL